MFSEVKGEAHRFRQSPLAHLWQPFSRGISSICQPCAGTRFNCVREFPSNESRPLPRCFPIPPATFRARYALESRYLFAVVFFYSRETLLLRRDVNYIRFHLATGAFSCFFATRGHPSPTAPAIVTPPLLARDPFVAARKSSI